MNGFLPGGEQLVHIRLGELEGVLDKFEDNFLFGDKYFDEVKAEPDVRRHRRAGSSHSAVTDGSFRIDYQMIL